MVEYFKWRAGKSCVFKNFIHLVFVTIYRRDVFTKPMLKRLKELFEDTCIQMDVELIELGGEGNHVHLIVCCPQKLAVSNLVEKLKGKSSYFLRLVADQREPPDPISIKKSRKLTGKKRGQ